MKSVIQIVMRADGRPTPEAKQFVASYDPNGNDGMGKVTFVNKPRDALKFESMTAAMQCYNQISTVRPVRDDGKSNRPLTAYTVGILNINS